MDKLPAFDLVLFGGTGDLATRKLIPALYRRDRAGELREDGRIISCGRSHMSNADYVGIIEAALRKRLRPGEWDDAIWARFRERLTFLRLNAREPGDYAELGTLLRDDAAIQRVFFLAITPELFVDICDRLHDAGLVSPDSRLVLEKPLGRDLESANHISDEIARIFPEERTFRIDHYLGKETVQNLLALRFGNALFEPLWRREWVHDVQITVSEHIGVEGRADFYDRTGALRDMVQSHLLQLLCIIAMEPPGSIEPDAVRNEKLKVLRSLRTLEGRQAIQNTVRGQYRVGVVQGDKTVGYRDEEDVPPDSKTVTFVALRADIDNWRWAGVPFYLRTGKRMESKVAEIVITFREAPHSLFQGPFAGHRPNRLVIRLQPSEELQLHLWAKAPGDDMALRRVVLDLDFADAYRKRSLDAYERLLCDIFRGQLTLFMRRDELMAAWRWVDPILAAWNSIEDEPRQYNAGTWGPAAASALLSRDDAAWSEEL